MAKTVTNTERQNSEKKFRKNYEYESHKGLVFPEETRTKQSFKDECDINSILKRYETTGILPDMIKENPQYGDFSDAGSYQEALNIVLLADEQFSALSAKVRERFQNDPAKFLAFAEDPRNGEELIKMGLATPAPDESSKAPISNPRQPDPVPPAGQAGSPPKGQGSPQSSGSNA